LFLYTVVDVGLTVTTFYGFAWSRLRSVTFRWS